jgi:3-oxoacyl-[acyl-carrier-protein] synthase-3
LGAKGDFRNKKILACGFGVGLSWGSLFFETTDFIVSELVEV